MRRSFVFLFLGVAAALGIWWGLRGSGPVKASTTAVTSLLPKETLAVMHLPDFKRSREQWHETDLYKLWREPAVQDFLQKPLARTPQTDSMRKKLQDMDALEIKDAFLALTAIENDRPSLLAGFRFKGSAADAEKVIGQWRTRLQENAPDAKRETANHEGQQIEIASSGAVTVATVYDGNWFFAGNDLPALKTLLDRADGRLKDGGTTLAADETFTAAFKHVPASYAAFGYARLDTYMEKLAAKLPPESAGTEQASMLRQIRSLSAATTFTGGKVRDVLFVAMPKFEQSAELTRSSLSLATKETFLYAANLLNFPKQFALPDPQAPGATAGPAGWQRFLGAFAASGVTRPDWESAFASEVGIIGDWPASSRLPALLATVAVKDAAKARSILGTLTAAGPAENSWTASESEGVQYYSQAPTNPMVPVAPTIGLSDRLLVAGLDRASVAAAIKRGAASDSGLTGSDAFKSAEKLVPTPKQSFTYLDTALFYGRLDAAVRPMLVMAAAFVPGIAETVDLGKLPAAEVITRHLSPFVMSQSYNGDGYVTESVGPISIYQAALGALGATGWGATYYQSQLQNTGATAVLPSPTPAAPVLPSPTPEETP